MEMDLRNPFVKILTTKIIKTVMRASVKLSRVGFATLFPIFPMATGMSVSPMVVITEPVTMAGK